MRKEDLLTEEIECCSKFDITCSILIKSNAIYIHHQCDFKYCRLLSKCNFCLVVLI